jgi:hypothetical protein
MTTDKLNSGEILDKAADAVRGATETVQVTSESIASAIEASRRPGGLLDQLTKLTREAPIRSVAFAFISGIILARRR